VNIVNIERMVIAGYEDLEKFNFYNKNQASKQQPMPKGKDMSGEVSDPMDASSASSIRIE